jgi:hypothetical protein
MVEFVLADTQVAQSISATDLRDAKSAPTRRTVHAKWVLIKGFMVDNSMRETGLQRASGPCR